VVINTHHLGTRLPETLGDGGTSGLRLRYSHEQEILGTGGGLVRARPWLGGGTFLLANADVISGVDLSAVVRFHRERGAAATLVVRPLPAAAEYTALLADEDDRLVGFKDIRLPAKGRARAVMFEGLAVLQPELFDFLPGSGFACVADQGYAGLLRAGRPVCCFPDPGAWFDLGTPGLYLAANREILSGRARFPQLDPGADGNGVVTGRSVELGPGASVGPEVALGDRCRVGAGARVARSVLWPGSLVAPGAVLDGAVVAGTQVLQAIR
jgi:NDP-sugar pyrophosphorylase family protein